MVSKVPVSKLYSEAFARLEEVVEARKSRGIYPALGYTSNLDLLCNFRVSVLNELIARHLPGLTRADLKIPAWIESLEDLLVAVAYFCVHGIGGEVEIADGEILKEHFAWVPGVGGTGVQAAKALAAIGCPSIVHLTDDSEEVCRLLDSPFIYTVGGDGRLIRTSQVVPVHPQEVHYIIQFRKGDVVELGEEKIPVPASNRLIVTKVTVNKILPFSERYFRYVEENAGSISSNVISSFNVILDQEIAAERLEYVKAHVEEYRSKNPRGIVFFEEAHYHSQSIRRLCAETIYSVADILSLNEEELQSLLAMYGFPKKADGILERVEGAKFLRERLGVRRGIIVHTKDYSMYAGDELEANIEMGLAYGNLLATAKAVHGTYGTREQIRELLKLEESERGLEARRRVHERGLEKEAVVVPTKYIDKPKYTIGLGDSFVAGVQLCFGLAL